MLALYVHIHSLLLTRDDRGQATAEYALVLIGAAGVAVLVSAWAKQSGGVGKLLDAVFKHLLGRVK